MSPEGVRNAITLLQRAIEIDPAYAAAHANASASSTDQINPFNK
jgi:hypothetical protein